MDVFVLERRRCPLAGGYRLASWKGEALKDWRDRPGPRRRAGGAQPERAGLISGQQGSVRGVARVDERLDVLDAEFGEDCRDAFVGTQANEHVLAAGPEHAAARGGVDGPLQHSFCRRRPRDLTQHEVGTNPLRAP
jgi:hypothetical protein